VKTVIIGGFVDYQVQLAKALNRYGDSLVIIYSVSHSLPEENIRAAAGVKLKLLSRSGPIYNPVTLLRFVCDFYVTLREIRRYRPDVVHFQIGSSMLAFLMLFLRSYPIVTTFHDVKPHSGEAKIWERSIHEYIRRTSRHLLVHGEKLRQMMIRDYGVSADKVSAIPIGPHNIEAFLMHAKAERKCEGNTVLFFGRILEYKGLEYLIKAEPLISAAVPDARIVIAGSGDDAKKYEAMMVHRERFMVINRHISYSEGAELFQRCSVVALPYSEASQSGVVSTAYGFCKAIVVTDVGAIAEIVDDGVTGLVVPPRDHVALAAAIVRLLKDPALREELGRSGNDKLRRDLSWDRIVRQTGEIYQKVTGRSDSAGERSPYEHSVAQCPEIRISKK